MLNDKDAYSCTGLQESRLVHQAVALMAALLLLCIIRSTHNCVKLSGREFEFLRLDISHFLL